MKKAILATKVGMTQIFNEDGVLTPVTVLLNLSTEFCEFYIFLVTVLLNSSIIVVSPSVFRR